jgi:hypothetical protein
MSRRSKRSREVDLFNFSFLDILACVIGLLIFILSIVVVSAGGQRNRQTDGRLSNAEHQLQQSREVAQRESDRRQRTEQILTEQSRDFEDPKAAALAVRGEISLFEGETARLDATTATTQSKVASLRQALQAVGQSPAPNPEAVAIQNQLRRLDEETAKLRNQAADERHNAQANVRQVQFYVPHERVVDVHRTLWIEVSGDRMWCISSADYVAVPVDEETTTYRRVQGAVGTSVTGLVTGRATEPASLSVALPEDTVLIFAVHPDGYEAFRKLRKWAWSKGFSVNWAPHDENSITLTHVGQAKEQ